MNEGDLLFVPGRYIVSIDPASQRPDADVTALVVAHIDENTRLAVEQCFYDPPRPHFAGSQGGELTVDKYSEARNSLKDLIAKIAVDPIPLERAVKTLREAMAGMSIGMAALAKSIQDSWYTYRPYRRPSASYRYERRYRARPAPRVKSKRIAGRLRSKRCR